MVATLTSWVDSTGNRPLFARTPELAPLLPQLDALYAQLGHIRAAESRLSPELKRLSRQIRQLDEVHHRKLRGLYNMLTDLIMLTDEGHLAAQLYDTRETLFPEGALGHDNRDLSQTGYAMLAEMKITPEMERLLTSTTYHGRTLFEDYKDWVSAGKALQYLNNDERARREEDSARPTATQADTRNARIRWNRLVKTIVYLLDVAPSLDEETKVRILHPLKCAEAATLRQAAGNGDAADNDLDVAAAMSELEASQRDTPVRLL
jgi:hypothetical protein